MAARLHLAFLIGGSELRGHVMALHSSSALAVNYFDYWTYWDKTPVLSALGINPEDGHVSGERLALETWWAAVNRHLLVVSKEAFQYTLHSNLQPLALPAI